MFTDRVIDGEGKLTSHRNKTASNVGTGHRAPGRSSKHRGGGVGFKCNLHHFTFIAHYCETFIEVTAKAFDQHGIVVVL